MNFSRKCASLRVSLYKLCNSMDFIIEFPPRTSPPTTQSSPSFHARLSPFRATIAPRCTVFFQKTIFASPAAIFPDNIVVINFRSGAPSVPFLVNVHRFAVAAELNSQPDRTMEPRVQCAMHMLVAIHGRTRTPHGHKWR